MKNNYGSYSFKVWIFTLILSPIVGLLISLLKYNELSNWKMFLGLAWIAFIYGIIISLPFYLLFTLLNWFLFKTNISLLRLKIYLTLIIPLFIGTAWSITFGFERDRDSLLYLVSTLFVVTVGIWIFKIEKEVRPIYPIEHDEVIDDIDFEK